MTAKQRRERNEARKGWAIIATIGLLFAAMVGVAAYADNSHGLSPEQSLASVGL